MGWYQRPSQEVQYMQRRDAAAAQQAAAQNAANKKATAKREASEKKAKAMEPVNERVKNRVGAKKQTAAAKKPAATPRKSFIRKGTTASSKKAGTSYKFNTRSKKK